ncbi:MAG: hypothetical protein A2Y33_01080 [Spirochaetes bacterium GWF1_51_8]|nr:MAG: hypothetical protein A2Y33_01080 [Spirochaetes bacterium GWF1_51_8]
MLSKILSIIGGFLTAGWGITHLIPTGNVVKGFGGISIDNSRIILMEWINEGFTLIFIGLTVILIALIEKKPAAAKKIVYILSTAMLIAMAVLSIFTGFQNDFLPYKLCPVIFTVSAGLIFQGVFTESKS